MVGNNNNDKHTNKRNNHNDVNNNTNDNNIGWSLQAQLLRLCGEKAFAETRAAALETQRDALAAASEPGYEDDWLRKMEELEARLGRIPEAASAENAALRDQIRELEGRLERARGAASKSPKPRGSSGGSMKEASSPKAQPGLVELEAADDPKAQFKLTLEEEGEEHAQTVEEGDRDGSAGEEGPRAESPAPEARPEEGAGRGPSPGSRGASGASAHPGEAGEAVDDAAASGDPSGGSEPEACGEGEASRSASSPLGSAAPPGATRPETTASECQTVLGMQGAHGIALDRGQEPAGPAEYELAEMCWDFLLGLLPEGPEAKSLEQAYCILYYTVVYYYCIPYYHDII